MTKDEVEKIVNDRYVECVQNQFDLWIIGLFYCFSDLALDDQKTAFFMLLTRLLKEGKVRFIKPGADFYYNERTNPNPKFTINDIEAHWIAPTEHIVQHLKVAWPEEADNKDNSKLNAYFYEIPALIWRDDEGQWHGFVEDMNIIRHSPSFVPIDLRIA
jgi:hypothetical protein